MKYFLNVVLIAFVVIGGFFIYREQTIKSNAKKAATAWEEAKGDTSIAKLDEIVYKYPQSEFAPLAERKRDSLILEKDWKKTKAGDSLKAYLSFKEKHPSSPYAEIVDAQINNLQRAEAWQNALKKNTIASYKGIISDYPASGQAARAKKKIIDLEVDKIFAGRHGVLPPPQKTAPGSSESSRISIENQTDYTLTVRYSGPRSIKTVLKAHAKNSLTLPSGQYRVAASVNHPNVIPFAGPQHLSGGEYSSVFYISGL